jgi:hypothetical protein
MNYEGPQKNSNEEPAEAPFDYLAHADRIRKERLAKEAAEKAERELLKKQERDERLAKQLARSASRRNQDAQKIERGSQTLRQNSGRARKEAEEARAVARELKEEVELPVPERTEVVLGERGEVTVSPNDSSDMQDLVIELERSAERTEETADIADEITGRAEAISRARGLIETIDSTDVGQSVSDGEGVYVPTKEELDLLAEEQNVVHDRITRSWAHESFDLEDERITNEQLGIMGAQDQEVVVDGYDFSGQNTAPAMQESYSGVTAPIVERPKRIRRSGFVPSVVGGALGGLFTTTKRPSVQARVDRLQSTEAQLAEQVQSLRQDVEYIQKSAEKTPTGSVQEVVETVQRVPAKNIPETRSTSRQEAIPSWVYQLESEIKNGRTPEIKTWQRDLLKRQHPELLERYERMTKLPNTETLQAQFEIVGNEAPKAKSDPTILPSPHGIYDNAMPAYMFADQPASAQPRYVPTYQPQKDGQLVQLNAGNYLATIVVGGVIFGALLIAVFGF